MIDKMNEGAFMSQSEVTHSRMPQLEAWRSSLGRLFENTTMNLILGALLILNLLTIGLETSAPLMDKYGVAIDLFNRGILCIFLVEIICRVIAHGLNFFKDPWHIIDAIIVCVAIFTIGSFVQIFRFIRFIWLLRLFPATKHFQQIVDSFVRAIPHLLATAGMIFLCIYVFGVIGTIQFGVTTGRFFGDLQTSMGTIAHSLMMPIQWHFALGALAEHHPYAWCYVMPLTIIFNVILLHMIVGLILSAIDRQYIADAESEKKGIFSHIFGKITGKEFHPIVHHPTISAETQMVLQELHAVKQALKLLHEKHKP